MLIWYDPYSQFNSRILVGKTGKMNHMYTFVMIHKASNTSASWMSQEQATLLFMKWKLYKVRSFDFFKSSFHFVCTSVLLACRSMHFISAWGPWRSGKGMGSPIPRGTDGCELHVDAKSHTQVLWEWQVPLTIEQSLQLPKCLL